MEVYFKEVVYHFMKKNCFSTENKLISCLLDIVFLFAGY